MVALRQRVLPDARRKGTQVALLACARPGWQLQTNADLVPLFKLVRLEPDITQSTQIRNQIVDTLAPHARAVLGTDRLLELCGLRPIIAMLIALEAEAQANLGRLDNMLRGVRPGELIGWLHKRLREDRLFPEPPADLLEDTEPALSVQAITAMLTGGPQERENLVACGSVVLDGDSERAEHLLGILIAMGWMVSVPNELAAVHDIVTDQFLEWTLLRPASWTVRTIVADRVLTSSLGRARTIGRYATNLGRMIRDLELDGHAESLKAYCANWLIDNIGRSGQVLKGQADEGAFALGAVIDSPCWSSVAFANWQSLVAPWLLHHSRTISARHVLYKGLRAVDTIQTGDLIPEATQWLAAHGTLLEASYVLAPLLAREDLGEQAAPAVEHAQAWLAAHSTTPEASYVLAALLAREDLGEQAAPAVEHAQAWLAAHSTTPEAGYVLPPLAMRLPIEELDSAFLEKVDRWVESNTTDPGISFIAKYLNRKGVITERIAMGVVKMVTANPRDENIAWDLSPVARTLDQYPSLAADVITALEMHLRMLPLETTRINSRSQFDGMLEQLARRACCRNGIIAARLDDLIDMWLDRPESLTSSTTEGSYFNALLSRILSLVYAGRFSRNDRRSLLERIRTWIGHWQCAQHEEKRGLAFELLSQAEILETAKERD